MRRKTDSQWYLVLCSTCENNFNSNYLKPIINCMWLCLLGSIKDLQTIAKYVNDN